MRTPRPGRAAASVALGALCLVYCALAALPAADGSDVVLATAGGSPDWLVGPLGPFGGDWTDGPLGGPLFYAGLWLALLVWAYVVFRCGALPRRAAIGAVVTLHALFLLAPPLLSQDVFSYIAYARLGVEHDLNPYAHAPADVPADPVYPFAGSKEATSAYGPLFTLLTYPLAGLGVPAAFWILKAAAALASLALVGVVWRAAQRLGRDPLGPALFVGLNPLTLVHVVGGAHNEAYVVLLTMLGVLAWLGGRPGTGGALATLAAGLKASAALPVAFLAAAGGGAAGGAAVAGAAGAGPEGAAGVAPEGVGPGAAAAGRRRRVLGGVAAGCAAIVAAAYAGFGGDALDALGLLSDNQERTSRWSFPYKTAELLGALLPGDRLDYRDPVRTAYALAFALVAAWLLLKTFRGADPIRMAGWTTVALLVASAWLVPWYVLWLLPLAALAADRRLSLASAALCAWMLVIAVPL